MCPKPVGGKDSVAGSGSITGAIEQNVGASREEHQAGDLLPDSAERYKAWSDTLSQLFCLH